MADWLIKWFKERWGILHVEQSIDDAELSRKQARISVQRAKKVATADGEQQWFLKLCDSLDPDEIDCPMPKGIDDD